MTVLAPWALWTAVAISATIVGLHVLASRNPRVTLLPTARFIPDVPLRATARALRLSDVLLMLLRVAVVMLVGLAVARPELTGAKRAVGRALMVDRSGNRQEAADSLRKYYEQGDIAFLFGDTVIRLRERTMFADARAERLAAESAGTLSAALVAGMRSASSLRGEADSVELVLISAFAAGELDAATSAIREAWPGRVRLVRLDRIVGAADRRVNIELRAASLDDPVRAALAFSAPRPSGPFTTDSVRIDRGALASADTTWTQSGLTLVRWPAALDSSGFARRARPDTSGAVMVARGGDPIVLVSPFARAVDPPAGSVVARWADGTPAATERPMMRGCVRDVAIPLPRAGDLALRESTRRLVAALGAPCGLHSGAPGNASDSTLARLRGTGPLVATRALDARGAAPGHLTTWLLTGALALLILEPLLRRQRAVA